MSYSAEDKCRILEEARATLARLKAEDEDRQRHQSDDDLAQRGDGWPLAPDPLARSNAGMDRWRAEAEAQEEKFRKAREARKRSEEEHVRQMTQADESWNAWVEAKIAAALDAHAFNDLQRDVIAQCIATERASMREHVAAELDKLRQDFLAVNKIVDLPSPVIRKVKDNAA